MRIKQSGFKSVEFCQAVVLTADEWTPESELVTATRRIQRKTIAQRYDAEVSVLFFFFSISSCCIVSSSLRTRARPYRDKSFAGGFYGAEMKPVLANRDFPINSILDPPQHPRAISCRLSPWVFLVFISVVQLVLSVVF